MSAVTFDAQIWVADSTGPWHFVSLPGDFSNDVRARTDRSRPGFGSVRVEATIGATTWRTSIFPDSKRGTYVLPIQASVRRAEGVEADDPVTVEIELLGE